MNEVHFQGCFRRNAADRREGAIHIIGGFYNVLSSRDAKKVYANCTAAVLRAKDCVMDTVTTVQENAGDIYAEAQQINEDRKAEECFEDESVEDESGEE